MSKQTFNKSLTSLCTVVVLLAISLAFSVNSARASGGGNAGYGKHEAACYIFAIGSGRDDAPIHAKRVQEQVVDQQQISYTIGYHTGALDAYAALGAEKSGSYEASRTIAAKVLYTAYKCSTAVEL